jgi:hypothetical protein
MVYDDVSWRRWDFWQVYDDVSWRRWDFWQSAFFQLLCAHIGSRGGIPHASCVCSIFYFDAVNGDGEVTVYVVLCPV